MEKKNIGDDMNRLRRNLIGDLKESYCLGSLVIVRDDSKKLLVSSVYKCVEWNNLFQVEAQFKVIFSKLYGN